MGYPDFLKVTVQFVMLGGYFPHIFGETVSFHFRHGRLCTCLACRNIWGIRFFGKILEYSAMVCYIIGIKGATDRRLARSFKLKITA